MSVEYDSSEDLDAFEREVEKALEPYLQGMALFKVLRAINLAGIRLASRVCERVIERAFHGGEAAKSGWRSAEK
jgi:hypothetical protein